jgi:hypothetical protein
MLCNLVVLFCAVYILLLKITRAILDCIARVLGWE